jgi:hypothetical protein
MIPISQTIDHLPGPPSEPAPNYQRPNTGTSSLRPNTAAGSVKGQVLTLKPDESIGMPAVDRPASLKSRRARSVQPNERDPYRTGYVFNPYMKNLQKNEVSLPRAKHQKNDVYLNFDNKYREVGGLDQALLECQKACIDYRFLFALQQIHISLDKTNSGYLSEEEFIQAGRRYHKAFTEETLKTIAECCSEIPEGGTKPLVSARKLAALTDQYKFAPKKTETMKHKNNSEQFTSLALGRPPVFLTKDSNALEHYMFLREKLTEKFIKISEAMRFFDLDHV